jgi:hypothetical protein
MRNATYHPKRATLPPTRRCATCLDRAPFTTPDGKPACGTHFDKAFEPKD